MSGCGDDDDAPVDAAIDAEVETDAGPTACVPLGLAWQRARVDLTPGATRTLDVWLRREACDPLEITLTPSADGVIEAPATATLATGTNLTTVSVRGVAVGTVTLTASIVARAGTPDAETLTAEVEIVVQDASVPACSGTASGNVAPGGSLRLGGTPVGVSLHERAGMGEFRVDPFDATLGCADDQVPEGYIPLGPAVTFGPGHLRFVRDMPMTIPIKVALLPEGSSSAHVFFSYTGPGVPTPRVVPVASPDLESQPGYVTFQAPRFGTYQAVTPAAGPTEREREFAFRGITGFSMGSGGAALVGIHNPSRFDFVGPLGGPVDWISLLHYIRTYHLGGFCTEAERQADPEACAGPASTDRTPPTQQRYEVRQNFESWYYEDDWIGHGGTFDRREYIRIFRDLAMMYGNPNTTASVDPTGPNVLPPGIPDSERMRSAADRCNQPYVIKPDCTDTSNCIEGRYYDDEYNPAGDYAVITFCDGAEVPAANPRGRDLGVWDPTGNNNAPVEVALAVDINGNGVRDPGEPVIRAGYEPFQDCGLDQLCNEDEPGYDAVTNPDPNGDDYDFQYNPTGTEGNWLRDYVGPAVGGCASPEPSPAAGVGEVFFDHGLDGVDGTSQLADGGFDTGEGDGCWTMSRGMAHMLANNPRSFVLNEDEAILRDLDFFGDGGIRDLFNFATNQDHLAGAFAARGLPINLYNSHASLAFDGRFLDDDLNVSRIDWGEIGKFVQLRYGWVDVSEGLLREGDGQHVGTAQQIVNRLLSVLAWMDARWPDGDRRLVADQLCREGQANCDYVNQISIEFEAPTTGRRGPASIVLPPGYFRPENAAVRYPAVYLLHGYGQDPRDLMDLGFVLWNLMRNNTVPTHRRMQKMIFVFPDGRCRGNECVKGTFYADAPPGTPDGAQMETFLLDLMDYVDANYRTRAPQRFTVRE
ncbi:MAG: hypothetical protein KF901_05845 [Myxococcales bacterium]|nr:hypothetical protein [Myxococcales bacterium]